MLAVDEEVHMPTRWQSLYSEGGKSIRGSAVRELFKVVQRPGMISFAGGMPAPELFPCEVVSEACTKVMRERGQVALQYSQTEGYNPLREYIAEVKMAELGLRAHRENVLITTGALQVMDLVPKILVNPGDPVVVEDPTFLGALASFSPYRPRYHIVPVDVCGSEGEAAGIQVDRLEEILAQEAGVKFIYVMPNFQNPVGCTLTLERRKTLVALANSFGVPVIEDDPYAELRYSGEPLPSLVVLDQQQLGTPPNEGPYEHGNVLYVGSFSKILSPGIRLGWVVGPSSIIAHLTRAKQGVDLHTSLPVQMVAYELCQQGFFPGHIARIRQVYRQRRDLMLSLMAQHFPEGVSWSKPEGGLFIWGTLPEGADAESILLESVEEKVAFVPGQSFSAVNGGRNTFRLNFSNATEEKIEEGIARLASVLRRVLHR
jgi:2-aminoadipate transaminase